MGPRLSGLVSSVRIENAPHHSASQFKADGSGGWVKSCRFEAIVCCDVWAHGCAILNLSEQTAQRRSPRSFGSQGRNLRPGPGTLFSCKRLQRWCKNQAPLLSFLLKRPHSALVKSCFLSYSSIGSQMIAGYSLSQLLRNWGQLSLCFSSAIGAQTCHVTL